jgi:CubicO group peptidase (beta-lactamase class C family)
MKLFVLLLIVILFIAGVSIQLLFASQSIPSNTEIQAILQQRIDKEKQSVGIVVGLINPKGSRIVSYGNLNQTSSRQPDGDTVFEIGSISKVFTSLLLADMVERKELSLKDPISKILPKSVKVPTRKGKEITLLDLAAHTSGLPRLPNNFESKDIENLTFPVKSLLQAANLHRGRVILTNLATVPGYQLVFCFDVLGSRQDER